MCGIRRHGGGAGIGWLKGGRRVGVGRRIQQVIGRGWWRRRSWLPEEASVRPSPICGCICFDGCEARGVVDSGVVEKDGEDAGGGDPDDACKNQGGRTQGLGFEKAERR